jgi:hypothetical protein
MSGTTLFSMFFGCFGFACAFAGVTRRPDWAFVAFLALVMVSLPLWQIATYAEQIAQAKP